MHNSSSCIVFVTRVCYFLWYIVAVCQTSYTPAPYIDNAYVLSNHFIMIFLADIHDLEPVSRPWTCVLSIPNSVTDVRVDGYHIGSLVQDCGISSAWALEIPVSH